MYLTPTNHHWACDIEADDLLDNATTIWCVCVENVETGQKHNFQSDIWFKEFLENEKPILVGHNFIAYDLVMLNRFWGTRIPVTSVVDTFVLSQLYHPTLAGGHSLEAWGERVRHKKTEHNDFSKFTPEMLEYCRNDTSLTALLYRKLTSRMVSVGFTEVGAEIEHLAWNIIQNKQRRHGFPFDKRKAETLYAALRQREEELADEIYKIFPPELTVVNTYRRAFKGDGSPSAQYERHLQQYPKSEVLEDGSYRVFDYVSFNIGSPKQRIEKLLALGWKPVRFTKKTDKGGGGNPQIDEESLLEFAEKSGKQEVTAIAKWLVVNSRANMIRTWLDAYNEETAAIHGKLFIASTLRYRHSNPNSANVPAIRKKKDAEGVERILYGEEGAWAYECRDLYTCGDPSEWCLVGIDGTGIQNRCLVHNLIKTVGEEAVKEFKELALEGDIHKRNIEVLGLANKAASKKFYYTLMMGGQGARLAADQMQFGTKMTAAEGTRLKDKMIASIPGFGDLIASLQKQLSKTGRIILCDGTPILVPSPHMVIPYLLQGDESRLMKKASIYLDEEIRKRKLRAYKCADIHDEWQFKVARSCRDEFLEVSVAVFPRTGEFFNYNVPIEGEAKDGLTWAETH